MTEKAIQNIYNNLFHWEGKHASQPYPIHKKLDSEKFGYTDIYKWIANIYKLNTETYILDAGCGVGYGSLYLSKYYNCNIKGISLSDAEVKKANIFAEKENQDNKVNFKQQSFDDLQPNTYDFIIAIESIKHTLDIKKTLKSLKNALKTNGILVIIDDFLIEENNSHSLKKYSKDWKLKVLLKNNDFSQDFSLKKDLTPFVITKNSMTLYLSILISSIMKPFIKIASIMRGGFYLEKLFKSGVMKYYVLEYKKL